MIWLRRLLRISTESQMSLPWSFLAVSNFDVKSELSLNVPLLILDCAQPVESRILDTIFDDELVTARAISTSIKPPVDTPAKNTTQPSQSNQRYIAEPTEPNRIQICLVTAELARAHARATLKDGKGPINGILAFDGEFISGNTSLVTTQCITWYRHL